MFRNVNPLAPKKSRIYRYVTFSFVCFNFFTLWCPFLVSKQNFKKDSYIRTLNGFFFLFLKLEQILNYHYWKKFYLKIIKCEMYKLVTYFSFSKKYRVQHKPKKPPIHITLQSKVHLIHLIHLNIHMFLLLLLLLLWLVLLVGSF